MIEIRDLHFRYGEGDEILRGVDLDIGPGVLGLLGPNGAGKSTLVKCLCGVHMPCRGTATYNGCSILGRRDTGRVRLSYLAQETPFISDLTVLEVMLLGRVDTLGLRVTDEDLDKAYHALEMFGIESYSERTFCEMSGGQQQMVMTAQCLVSDPEVIILDEPTNNLDLRKELEMFDMMTGITRERGITTMMVLHDVNFASRYCDRLAVMRMGELYAYDTPENVISEQMIRDVYGVEASVSIGGDGRPRIDPLRAV